MDEHLVRLKQDVCSHSHLPIVNSKVDCGFIRRNRRKLPILHYSSAPVSTGNTFQDLPRLRETADNTERYI